MATELGRSAEGRRPRWGPREPEADVGDAQSRATASAHGRAQAPRPVGPTAAAQRPVAAVALPVQEAEAALPHVADGVEQAPRVRTLPADLGWPPLRVAAAPGDVVQLAGGSGARRLRGVLPLGHRRQPSADRSHSTCGPSTRYAGGSPPRPRAGSRTPTASCQVTARTGSRSQRSCRRFPVTAAYCCWGGGRRADPEAAELLAPGSAAAQIGQRRGAGGHVDERDGGILPFYPPGARADRLLPGDTRHRVARVCRNSGRKRRPNWATHRSERRRPASAGASPVGPAGSSAPTPLTGSPIQLRQVQPSAVRSSTTTPVFSSQS
ncbi:MAG: hypothetical protein JWP66_1350 [Naasia sp.]|nr:hypothetical protein [Naasia sp.]